MKVPTYNLHQVFKTRQALLEILQRYCDTELVGDEFEALVSELAQRYKPLPRCIIAESLDYLVEVTLTEREAGRLAWRLAGNSRQLKRWTAVRPWSRQVKNEWVPAEVARIFYRRRGRRLGYGVQFQILAGTSCPEVAQSFWTAKYIRYLASYLGFSKPWGQFPIKHPVELLGLRCNLLITRTKSLERPGFDKVQVTPGLQTYNKKVIRSRSVAHGRKCPHQFTHECFRCPYGADRCEMATHLKTYVKQFCELCNKDAWFDPDRKRQKICNDCTYATLTKDST